MGVGQELFARRRDGSEFPVEISLSPIGDSADGFVAAAIRDATERRATENALRLARAEADRANLAKSRFLATASHDLRQPLQALSLLNGTLQRQVRDPAILDAVHQQGLAIATVSRLLNALLDISKLESGAVPVEITDFDVRAVLEELRDDFKPVAANKGLALGLDGERVRVKTDRTLVMQVLRNLLSNAFKYTDRGSIRLRCRQRDGMAIVDVADTGIGISRDHLQDIFEEFFQVGALTHTSREGYGLGLSIVQRIARLLDLRISVESAPGSGSCFSISLPLGMSSATDADFGNAPPRGRSVLPTVVSILLVEDDASVRKATQMFLRSEGYQVYVAASLKEAERVAASVPRLDLVISDYHLEEARGTAVIAALRARFGEHLPSILVTGDTSSAVMELPRDSQLRIISKPVNAEELLDVIRILCPRKAD